MENAQRPQQLKRKDSLVNSLISDDDDDYKDDDEEGKSTSSKSLTSSTGYSVSSSDGAAAARQEIRDIMRKETKAVLMWQEIVTGMLVITACFVTITTYIILSRQEVDDFTAGVSQVRKLFWWCCNMITHRVVLYEIAFSSMQFRRQ